MPKRGAGRSVPQKPVERDALPPGTEPVDAELFFNRELSWLASSWPSRQTSPCSSG
jgi:polyphosphate kinase